MKLAAIVRHLAVKGFTVRKWSELTNFLVEEYMAAHGLQEELSVEAATSLCEEVGLSLEQLRSRTRSGAYLRGVLAEATAAARRPDVAELQRKHAAFWTLMLQRELTPEEQAEFASVDATLKRQRGAASGE